MLIYWSVLDLVQLSLQKWIRTVLALTDLMNSICNLLSINSKYFWFQLKRKEKKKHFHKPNLPWKSECSHCFCTLGEYVHYLYSCVPTFSSIPIKYEVKYCCWVCCRPVVAQVYSHSHSGGWQQCDKLELAGWFSRICLSFYENMVLILTKYAVWKAIRCG